MAIAVTLLGNCTGFWGRGLIYSLYRVRTILETYLKGLRVVVFQEPDANTECRFYGCIGLTLVCYREVKHK